MKKVSILSACLVAGLALGAKGADDAGKAALPAGHPAMGKASASPAGDMPAGHPSVAGDLPAGHPAMPAAEGGGALPAGHPSMASLKAAATQPAGPAKITVRAVQGTKGGPSLGKEPVVIEVYGEGSKLLKTFENKLGAQGEATVEFPGDVLCQPVARITHAGVTYEGIGEVIDRTHREQRIEMMLYEVTEKRPEWTANIRHVLVYPQADGLRVTEMLAINNPGDQTWIGPVVNGQRATFSLPLTPGAFGLNVPGMAEGAIQIRDGKVVSSLPVTPGSVELQMEYTVPLKDGKADLSIIAPAAVGQTYVFIPDDGSTVTTFGLDSLGVRQTGEGSKRGFKTGPMKPGQEAKMSFSGLKAPTTAPVKKVATTRLPQIVAGVGGGIVLLGGVTFLLVKSPRKTDAS